MGPQQDAFINIKGVLHIPGRVVGREIQRLKIIVIQFHLGTFGYFKAQSQENILYLIKYHYQRVAPAHLKRPAGQGHIYGLFP